MGHQESGIELKKYFKILKGITLAVQITPFIYSLLYLIVLVLNNFASDALLNTLDCLFYISPLFVIAHLIYSRILHLCKWHRIACILPLFPLFVSLVDYYIISLSEVEAFVTNGLTILMIILLLIAAYKVFFANGR